MRNALKFISAAILTAGAVSAEDSSGSSLSIMDQLMQYTSQATEAAPAPVADVAPAREEVPTQLVAAEKIVPAAKSELEALVDQGRADQDRGAFDETMKSFEQATELNSTEKSAPLYTRTSDEKAYRTAEGNALEAVADAWSAEMVLRPYALAADARAKMDLANVEGAVDVEGRFGPVAFPKGSSAIYESDSNMLFVRNTPANLSVLEGILDAMEILKETEAAEQVEIEAKFVEVAEGTLEELGFEWDFEGINGVGVGGTDVNVSDNDGLFAGALRGSSVSPALPFNKNQLPVGGDVRDSYSNWKSFRMQDTFNNSTADSNVKLKYSGDNAFETMISALDQSSGADVLSAPRVVTKSGEEATIRVGERHYFPEVYEGSASQATILQVNYEDWEEKLLGVELSVSPEVDGNEITLGLKPRITELSGWREYTLAAANSVYTHRQGSIKVRFEHPPVIARLPVFKKREIETEVTMTDGSTIGMGGLIHEKTESFEDKVPVLGSLPLVGRLFRNEGERAVKRNLLMFVSAKVVNPNGRVGTLRNFE